MSPTARKVARLAGEIDSIGRRLKNLVPELQALDFAEKALKSATKQRWEKAAEMPVELHITVDPKGDEVKTDQQLFDEIPSLK